MNHETIADAALNALNLGQVIDGEIVPSTSSVPRELVDPATGATLVEVAEGDVDDVGAAVDAAAAAWPQWSRATPADRSARLLQLADCLEGAAADFAAVESLNGESLWRLWQPKSSSPSTI